MNNLLEIVSDESDFYNLFLDENKFEADREFLEGFLQTEDIPDSVILSEEQVLDLNYLQFLEYSNYYFEGRLQEFIIPKAIKEKFDFIKELAKQAKTKFTDLLKLFTKKEIFRFFSEFDWSLKNIFDLAKKGFNLYRDIQKIIAQYVADSKVGKWTQDKLKDLDNYLSKHPKIKRIGGVVVAGILLAIWLNMSFTGDFLDDMDLSNIFLALRGKYSLAEFFGTPDGIRMLMLLATGMLGVSFPWANSSAVNFAVAVVTTLGKMFGQRFKKAKDSDIDKEADKLSELTIRDWKRPSAVMPIIKRTTAVRKDVAGEEKVLSKFLGVSGRPNSPILNFRTRSTFDETKEYRTRIQLMELSKWRTDKYLYNLTVPELKEILDVCDIKFHCECKFFHWGGLAYMATELDSAIEPVSIPNPVWSKKKGYSEPSVCKHLNGVLKLIKPNAGKILKVYKDRYSTRFRNTTN